MLLSTFQDKKNYKILLKQVNMTTFGQYSGSKEMNKCIGKQFNICSTFNITEYSSNTVCQCIYSLPCSTEYWLGNVVAYLFAYLIVLNLEMYFAVILRNYKYTVCHRLP